MVYWGWFPEVFWLVFWELIIPTCTTIFIFRVWKLSVRSLFRDLLLEGVWDAFFRIWVPVGSPIGIPFGHFRRLLRALNFEAVSGTREQKRMERGVGGPAAGAGLVDSVFGRIQEEVLHA